jgi:hypothetical protein
VVILDLRNASEGRNSCRIPNPVSDLASGGVPKYFLESMFFLKVNILIFSYKIQIKIRTSPQPGPRKSVF